MQNTNDLTRGQVSSRLLGFFFPMLLTNTLQQAYTFVDTIIVGKQNMHKRQDPFVFRLLL